MSDIKRSTLFGKLNPVALKSVEAATRLCQQRGNPYVELAHWLTELLEQPNSDFQLALQHFRCDLGRLARDILPALDRLPCGATAVSDFSPHLDEAVERAWTFSSLVFGDQYIRTGHVLLGLLRTPGLKNVLLSLSPEFAKIKADALADDFPLLLEHSKEQSPAISRATLASPQVAPTSHLGPYLERFTDDLTDQARVGKLDPVVGRDAEIRQCIDILLRRRQNNPMLVGEAGVGKTAIAEGLALRIVSGDVPAALHAVTLLSLDTGALQAGASTKGELEERLRGVVQDIQASAQPVILFMDEAHVLMSSVEAANFLKPALARGSLRSIAATTWREYKRHVEKDGLSW